MGEQTYNPPTPLHNTPLRHTLRHTLRHALRRAFKRWKKILNPVS